MTGPRAARGGVNPAGLSHVASADRASLRSLLHPPTETAAMNRPALPRLLVAAALAVAVSLTPRAGVRACYFCNAQGGSFASQCAEAAAVVAGRLTESRRTGVGSTVTGTSRFEIDRVLKGVDLVGAEPALTLNRYLEIFPDDDNRYLMFFANLDGQLRAYKSIELRDPKTLDYYAKALELETAAAADRLGFYFRHLEDADRQVSLDAYQAFAVTPYGKVKAAKDAFDPATLRQWIAAKDTQAFRLGLYGVLLGLIGDSGDADLLRRYCVDPALRPLSGVDGLLGGYCLLRPADGTALVVDILTRPDEKLPYYNAALKTLRFIVAELPQVDQEALFAALTPALRNRKIADLVVREFTTAERWRQADRIFALYADETLNDRLVKRAVVRYAMLAPADTSAGFLAQARADDAELVASVTSDIEFERQQAAAAAARQAEAQKSEPQETGRTANGRD